jgi:hypothetical protein
MLWSDNKKSSSNVDLKITDDVVSNSVREKSFLEGILWFVHVIYPWGPKWTRVGQSKTQPCS